MLTDKEQQDIIDSVIADHASSAFEAAAFRARIIEVIQQQIDSGIPEEKWPKIFESVKLEAAEKVKAAEGLAQE